MNPLLIFKRYWKRQKKSSKFTKEEILGMIHEEPSVVITPIYAKRKWFNI